MLKHQEYCEKIFEQLTHLQVRDVLDALLGNIKKDDMIKIIELLDDEDAADTLTRIIFPEKNRRASNKIDTASAKSTSDAKFEEEWDSIIGNIQCIIDDVGDEDGPYVSQDRHWEPPNFMGEDVTLSLEAEAEKLYLLLERAYELKLADINLFKEMYIEINDNVALYPEYFWGVEETVGFDNKMTACLVKWLFLNSEDCKTFLGNIIDSQEKQGEWGLNKCSIQDTLLDIYKENAEELYNTINMLRQKNDNWKKQLADPASVWHKIFYSLTGKYDSDVKIEMAMSTLDKDWTKGDVLLKHYQNKGDAEGGIKCCKKVVEAYMSQNTYPREKIKFNIDKEFIETRDLSEKENHQITRTLDAWYELCVKSKNIKDAELLNIQRAYFVDPQNWDRIKDAFYSAPHVDTEKLKEQFIKNTVTYSRISGYQDEKKDNWIAWLMEAVMACQPELFFAKCKTWLKKGLDAPTHKYNFYMKNNSVDYPEYFSLINDIIWISSKNKEFPNLVRLISGNASYAEACRQKWLCDVNGQKLFTDVDEFLNKHILQFIPDPGGMSANYENAVEWLLACEEVAPEKASKLLSHWKVDYKRKRNLWRDLKMVGLD